jgi:hypothetical protein
MDEEVVAARVQAHPHAQRRAAVRDHAHVRGQSEAALRRTVIMGYPTPA